jgi:CheY-like chemotaxis protein
MIVSLGHKVIPCHNGQAALETASTTFFDVLLTDVLMPGEMDGLDLAREIKEIKPRVRIILMTGYAELLSEAQQDSESEILRKPIRRKVLANALEDASSGELA